MCIERLKSESASVVVELLTGVSTYFLMAIFLLELAHRARVENTLSFLTFHAARFQSLGESESSTMMEVGALQETLLGAEARRLKTSMKRFSSASTIHLKVTFQPYLNIRYHTKMKRFFQSTQICKLPFSR